MQTGYKTIAGMCLENAPEVRGINGGSSFRLTRTSDGASVLLHSLDENVLSELARADFTPDLPDFSKPFVSTFAGVVSYRGKKFLVEPLPPVVPMLDVWAHIVCKNAVDPLGVLGAFSAQLKQALNSLRETDNGAQDIGIENVILTTSGVYGLLRTGLATSSGWLCLRPTAGNPTRSRNNSPASPDEYVHRLLGELIEVSESLRHSSSRLSASRSDMKTDKSDQTC